MRSLKKRGPHVLDDLMTSYFPYKGSGETKRSRLPPVMDFIRRRRLLLLLRASRTGYKVNRNSTRKYRVSIRPHIARLTQLQHTTPYI